MQEGNNYLKRGKGKKNGDILRRDFFNYYKDQVEDPYKIKEYSKFLSALLEAYSHEIIENNMILHLAPIGKIRIKTHKHTPLTPEGKIKKSNKVDWKKTFEYWHKKYPGLTRDELLNLDEKLFVIYHENNHSNGEVSYHYWERGKVKNAAIYKFYPTREFSRLLAKTILDPKRKTYYYG